MSFLNTQKCKLRASGALLIIVAVCLLVPHGVFAQQSGQQAQRQLVKNKQECIDQQLSKKSDKKLRNIGNVAIKKRQRHIDNRFNIQKINRWYHKLDRQINKANQRLKNNQANNRVVKPRYHIEQIKRERINLKLQLEEKEKVTDNSEATLRQLAVNNCEIRWDLRVLSYAGRKWRAQHRIDILNTRTQITKAYWLAANKPEKLNPARFESQLNSMQAQLDKLSIPRRGQATVMQFNPKDQEPKVYFKNNFYQPQRSLNKKIAKAARQLRSRIAPPIPKVKNRKGSYVQLPVSPNNQLYYIYGYNGARTGNGGKTPPNERFGKPALVKLFQNVAVKFHKKYPETKLVAGDLNAQFGHASHKSGVDIDVYAQNYMAADMRGKHRSGKSVQRSITLGKLFMDSKKIDKIFYNDPAVIKKVNTYARRNKLPGKMMPSNSTHEFHMHVRIR